MGKNVFLRTFFRKNNLITSRGGVRLRDHWCFITAFSGGWLWLSKGSGFSMVRVLGSFPCLLSAAGNILKIIVLKGC